MFSGRLEEKPKLIGELGVFFDWITVDEDDFTFTVDSCWMWKTAEKWHWMMITDIKKNLGHLSLFRNRPARDVFHYRCFLKSCKVRHIS